MARASTKQQPLHTPNDWKFILTLVLTLTAGVANYTTQQNSVLGVQRDVSTLQDDIKELSRTRERTTVLETKFVGFDQTLTQVASDVRYLREGLSTASPKPPQPIQPHRYR